jgi:hypothetical protein
MASQLSERGNRVSLSGAAVRELGRDFRFQADYVVDQAWRLQAMQDMNPMSPSFGCFHYAYWRDKTSEFPDARFQEAGATLALLSLPMFDGARADGRLASSHALYAGFSAALGNWARQQHAEGSFDEWYKGERGFAATAFTTIAFGLAARFLGTSLAAPDRSVLADAVAKAGAWLARRDDKVKSNHEAAAAAALALAWELTGDQRLRAAARAKLENTLRRQHGEGWFPEVGGMDLGYCSVLLDYVMLHALVTGDDVALPAMSRLAAFMLPLLHPDGTISPEMGLCLNPYVGRLGMGLLSARDDNAARLVGHFTTETPGQAGLRPVLADDLRLARWSHVPLVTALLAARFRPAHASSLLEGQAQGWTWSHEAGVGAYHAPEMDIYVAAAGAGATRVFAAGQLVYEDLEFLLDSDEGRVVACGYDRGRPVTLEARGVRLSCRLCGTRFVFPGLPARLVLRLGATTAVGARLVRAVIDAVRIRRRTASNQSAAPTAGRPSPYLLERSITVDGAMLDVSDRLGGAPGVVDVSSVVTAEGSERRLRIEKVAADEFRLVKTLDLRRAPGARFEWRSP